MKIHPTYNHISISYANSRKVEGDNILVQEGIEKMLSDLSDGNNVIHMLAEIIKNSRTIG